MPRTVYTVDYVDGGVSDFIFNGRTDKGQTVRFFVPAKTIAELARLLETAGEPGHAIWHQNNPNQPTPCNSCFPRKYA